MRVDRDARCHRNIYWHPLLSKMVREAAAKMGITSEQFIHHSILTEIRRLDNDMPPQN